MRIGFAARSPAQLALYQSLGKFNMAPATGWAVPAMSKHTAIISASKVPAPCGLMTVQACLGDSDNDDQKALTAAKKIYATF
jgi:hypothetical protein